METGAAGSRHGTDRAHDGERARSSRPRSLAARLVERHDGRRRPRRASDRRTDAEAASIVDRPVTILDFMATVCRILGIDHDKQNQAPNGRPIRIVDRGAIRELL